MKSTRDKLIPFLFFFFLLSSYIEAIPSKTAEIFKGKTKLTEPLTLRDPFKEPSRKYTKSKKSATGRNKDGVYTNLDSVDSIRINNIRVIGVVTGANRRAIVQVGIGRTVILKEGMLVGDDKLEVKAIMPGGIVLVEKIVNVYGQEEYLETIVPVSTPTK